MAKQTKTKVTKTKVTAGVYELKTAQGTFRVEKIDQEGEATRWMVHQPGSDGTPQDKPDDDYSTLREAEKAVRGQVAEDEPAKKKKPATKLAAKKAAKKNGTLYRVATVVNPKTDREATVPVKTDGTQLPRFDHLPAAKEWRVIRATGWADATAQARAGKGELVKAGKQSK